MIKRTLYFGNPAYLRAENKQLVVVLPEQNSGLRENDRKTSIPIEDIGVVVIDHQQISVTSTLMHLLLENNVAFITCNAQHLPTGMMLNLEGNSLQAERFRTQIDASLPLKKQLWAQTVEQKIRNQAMVMKKHHVPTFEKLITLSKNIKSGDPENQEGRAAAIYWQYLFGAESMFIRDREGKWPNALLNYGYAILRAITARSLVGSGLLPTLGIHHRNKYNAYCLADDIMEPYRPFVDDLVIGIYKKYQDEVELNSEIKSLLLSIPVLDVMMSKEKSPLMVAMQRTTSSLNKCFVGEINKMVYPEFKA